jgi:hypothetical protein
MNDEELDIMRDEKEEKEFREAVGAFLFGMLAGAVLIIIGLLIAAHYL